MRKLRVGYTCNVRNPSKDADERYNEWEPPETVEAVAAALADAGCEVSVIDVGPDIFHVLERRRSELDLVFNNAEGLEESAHGGPRMRIFDRDGTEATMCGNGIRCAARYFRDHGCVTGSHFTIATLDGPKPVSLENRWVTVDMGRARGYRRLAEDRHFAFTGIPHLVILAGGISVDAARAEGRRLRYDRALGATLGHPDGVHVNFVQVSGDGSLDVLTYEAGVEDVTPACGTGSTAAAYVCARIGRTSLPVRVRLLGGELVIDARGDSMTMRGPAEYMRPFALDVSRLGGGAEPPAEIAGRVVAAGGRMWGEEGRA